MAKIVDITEKLDFEQKPQIKVKNVTVTVNNEATAVLKLIPLFGGNASPKAISEMLPIMFSDDDIAKIESLRLNFNDFATVIECAIELVMGESQPGEAQTPATT